MATTTPDKAPAPNRYRSHLRDHEYKRFGTVSLLAGLDLHTGRVTETVSDTHSSGDFIGLLKMLGRGYPPQTKIRVLLDNHSAHTSKQTQAFLEMHPQRFEFVFTPKHGSWLIIIETIFSTITRSILREIRVASKRELIDRICLYFAELNADPVIFDGGTKWMTVTRPTLKSDAERVVKRIEGVDKVINEIEVRTD